VSKNNKPHAMITINAASDIRTEDVARICSIISETPEVTEKSVS
jgi:hypothetical protein